VGVVPLADRRAVGQQQQHGADDGSDEAAEVEGLVVADAEQLREDQEADERAGEAEQDRDDEAAGILPGQMAFAMNPATRPRMSAPIMGWRLPA
jgi:hypothetical protein